MVMVDVKNNRPRDNTLPQRKRIVYRLGMVSFVVFVLFCILQDDLLPEISKNGSTTLSNSVSSSQLPLRTNCIVSSISQIPEEVLNPKIGLRWIVTPPKGGNLHLMCCETTKGALSILLHEQWAPKGVTHLLKMLAQGYFDRPIPLFRCTDACQFGLSSNTTLTKQWDAHITDDPAWLPTGPNHRTNADGISRYPKGVLTHAGGGPNTRSNQFVLTLKPNKFMGGGSPWEIPMGEVVSGDAVLDQLYTGYGEKGHLRNSYDGRE